MIGLKVTINEKSFLVGLNESNGVVTSIVDLSQKRAKTKINFNLSGLDSETNVRLKWLDQSLTVGDEIRIKVVKTDHIDPPNVEPF